MKRDYDDNGNLIPGHLGVIRPNPTVMDLSKALAIDSPYDDAHPNPNHFEDGLARLKIYIEELKAECTAPKAQNAVH